ncbi:CHC2 zinc finger domain-containing protein [Desertivirga xinjiangensis]|uniref:CHC2 zinc finger domain-containing protein n=1 Tax=Desertivirga xinjiangensis TaxID=539206 RepID=UPI00210C8418|nr:CHC2 zinc finger domain-containing protein [Pedobacter xinjiangensis]
MEISEIKQQLTVAQVLSYYNLKPDKNLRLHCPFHEDKTPSMQVYYKTQTCYCFSSGCKTHGKSLDVIDFIMHKENLSKHEAIKQAEGMIKGGSQPANTTAMTKEAFLQKMFSYFRNAVHNSKPAQEYISSRKLDFTKLEIGYNAAQFHHGTRKDETLIEQCLKYGLLIDAGQTARTGEKAYRVFGKSCIVFALKNKAGQISGLYFRSTLNTENAKHFYLKDRSGLYPGYPKAETRKLIITESIIDAATLLQIKTITENYSVLAAYGTNGLNEEMVNAIKELKELEEITFAFDTDEAGKAALIKYAGELHQLLPHLSLSALNLPLKDVNETALAHDDLAIFGQLLEERNPLPPEGGFALFLSPENISSIEKKNPAPDKAGQKELPALNTKNPWKITYASPTARYAILGGISKQADSMKVTLVIESGTTKSRTKLDLYEDKQVEKVSREVAEKIDLRADQLEADLYKLTDLLETYREEELLKIEEANPSEEIIVPLTAQEREQAEALARDKNLITSLNETLGKAGIVGEEKNRLFLFIIALSYKMPDTLHALIQGSSGSGKTRLLKQIADCMPPEKVTKLTRVSDKALYNYPERFFINRLLCLEDIDGLPEEAGFAFRELQSNGELTSATSIKLENGQITSGQKTVKGPIASMACTTRGEIYEDNMGRVFLIAVDESSEQTKRIIHYQNEKAAGQLDGRKEQETRRSLQNFVRILKSYEVLNPFANQIHLPQEAHKIRRLNDLFQSFVKMVTILSQYQRKKDGQGRLIAELADIETAVNILFESIVLKVDELDGSLRQFFEQLKNYLEKKDNGSHQKAEFSLLEVRQALAVS